MTLGALFPVAVLLAELTGAPLPEARSEPEWRAVRGGGFLFGGAYALCLGGAATEGFRESSGRLAIPVAGPWLALDSGINAWALVMAGTAQAAGVSLIVWGFASPRRVLGPAKASLSLTGDARSSAVTLDLRF